jgi:hypothetical protein
LSIKSEKALNFPRFSGHTRGLLYNQEEECQGSDLHRSSRMRQSA